MVYVKSTQIFIGVPYVWRYNEYASAIHVAFHLFDKMLARSAYNDIQFIKAVSMKAYLIISVYESSDALVAVSPEAVCVAPMRFVHIKMFLCQAFDTILLKLRFVYTIIIS